MNLIQSFRKSFSLSTASVDKVHANVVGPTDVWTSSPIDDNASVLSRKSSLSSFKFRFPSQRRRKQKKILSKNSSKKTTAAEQVHRREHENEPSVIDDLYDLKTESSERSVDLNSALNYPQSHGTLDNLSHLQTPFDNAVSSSCPVCKRKYGPGTRRRLEDSQCGHSRCYECMFTSEVCMVCAISSPKQQAVILEHSPGSQRSSAYGRESGFQSYASINSDGLAHSEQMDVEMKNSRSHVSCIDEDDFDNWSQCSSSTAISLMSASQGMPSFAHSRFSRDFQRRSLCSLRSYNGAYSERKSLSSRTSFGRRSTHIAPLSRPWMGMSAIHENSGVNGERECQTSSAPPENSPEPFVGRSWVFRDISDHLNGRLPTNGGFIICGGPGSGKTAILRHLVFNGPHSPSPFVRSIASRVIAHHFADIHNESSCLVANFVHDLVQQLRHCPILTLGAYRKFIDSSQELSYLTSLQGCQLNPDLAFTEGILKPLLTLRSLGRVLQQGYYVIVIDGLCSAEYYRSDGGQKTIAAFLEEKVALMPNWIKIICSVRTQQMDIVQTMPFQRLSLDNLDGLDERLSKDVKDYVSFRLSRSSRLVQNTTPTQWKYEQSPQTVFADYLLQVSQGSFLYLRSVLNLIEKGSLVIKSANFSVIPQSISEIFLLQMNLLFPSQLSFSKAKEIFSVCLASLRTLTLESIYQCIQATKSSPSSSECSSNNQEWNDFLKTYSQIKDFLHVNESDGTIRFVHETFREWLVGRRSCDTNKFACDLQFGHNALALWLSRKESADLKEQDTLELAHHILKGQLFKAEVEKSSSVSVRDLQALWLSMMSADLSRALVAKRNISNPNIVISKLLLMAGASPNVRIDEHGLATPLITQFISRSHEQMVHLLIDFGADLEARDSKGVTPLMVAASNDRNVSIVRYLLEKRPSSLNQSCNDGSTPLAFAAKMGAIRVLRLLLELSWPSGGCSRSIAVQEALLASIKVSQEDAIRVLLAPPANAYVNEKCSISHEMPMEAAIFSGKKTICDLLLNNGADLTKVSRPLHLAIEAGHWSVVELLIKHGCKVSAADSKGKTPLVIAAVKGEVAIADLLLSRGAKVDDDKDLVESCTPLSWACREGKERMVECLIGHSADVNAKDNQLRTPLHQAATSGNDKIVTKLLESGAQIEAVDKNGIRPIDQAICFSHRECVGIFLRKGAKLGPTTWTMAKGKPIILLMLLNKLLEDGNTLYKNGRFKDAIYRYEYALKRLPKGRPGDQAKGTQIAVDKKMDNLFSRLKIHLLLNLARTHRQQDDLTSAIVRTSQALEHDPSSFEALWARAKARYEWVKKEHDRSSNVSALEQVLEDLRKALQIFPQNLNVHKFIAEVKDTLAREEQAIMSIENLENDQNNAN